MLWDLIVNNDDICFTHMLTEIESNGSEILARSERDESVDQEIVSRERLKETFDEKRCRRYRLFFCVGE